MRRVCDSVVTVVNLALPLIEEHFLDALQLLELLVCLPFFESESRCRPTFTASSIMRSGRIPSGCFHPVCADQGFCCVGIVSQYLGIVRVLVRVACERQAVVRLLNLGRSRGLGEVDCGEEVNEVRLLAPAVSTHQHRSLVCRRTSSDVGEGMSILTQVVERLSLLPVLLVLLI